MYFLAAGLNYTKVKEHRNRASNYREYVDKMNTTSLKFPINPINDKKTIEQFEINNNITINIFTVEQKEAIPIYITSVNKNLSLEHVNILYWDNHFLTITKLESFLSPTGKKCHNYYTRCNYCFCTLSTDQSYRLHKQQSCQLSKGIIRQFPSEKSFLQFKNYKFMQQIPVVLYWDTEVYQVDIDKSNPIKDAPGAYK